MGDLAEFLLARIAEDEHRLDLPEAISARGDGWVSRGDCPVCGAYQFDGTESVTEEAWWEHAETVHQRTRVLAECEAKRRIVRTMAANVDRLIVRRNMLTPEMQDYILQLLALPYADRLGYRSEWRP